MGLASEESTAGNIDEPLCQILGAGKIHGRAGGVHRQFVHEGPRRTGLDPLIVCFHEHGIAFFGKSFIQKEGAEPIIALGK